MVLSKQEPLRAAPLATTASRAHFQKKAEFCGWLKQKCNFSHMQPKRLLSEESGVLSLP